MTISTRTLDAIRERVQIVDLFEPQKPRKSGSRFVCSCPFHAHREGSKSQSLTIYPDQGKWHCFSCKAHGDLFEALMLLDQVDFVEAVERLAKRAGITVEHIGAGSAEKASGERTRRAAAFAAAEWATTWMQGQLAANAAAAAMGYLRVDRHLPPEIITRWRLGWSPGDVIITAAKAAGHDVEALRDAGLVVERDGLQRSFFYERIMVPIHNANGRVCGWTARAMPDAIRAAAENDRQIPKYLNPGDNQIYQKGRVLLGIREARPRAKGVGALLVVEGALDVIALDAIGQGTGVCTCGLGLSDDQAATLTDVSADLDVPVVCLYDIDRAGKDGARRNVELLWRVGARARVGSLPSPVTDPHGASHQVKDAADLWEKLGLPGAEHVTTAIASSVYAIDYLLARAAPAPKAMDLDQRLAAADRLLEAINQVEDGQRRELALTQVAEYLDITRSLLTARSEDQRKEAARGSRGASSSTPAVGESAQGGWGFHIPPPTPDASTLPSPDGDYELNELGNAMRFAARYGASVRYVTTWGAWLIWTGTHWRLDTERQAERWFFDALNNACADEQSRAWDKARAAPKNSRDAEAWTTRAIELERWRIKNCGARAKSNSLEVAQSLRCLVVTNEQLDADPTLFACENGWVDLITGELHDHDRGRLYTRCCPVPFDPTARDQRWELFLDQFTSRLDEKGAWNCNTGVLAFLHRWAGYCATGNTDEQAVLMLSGPGGNGKTLFASCVRQILGSYAYDADFAIFLASHGDRQKWTLANLEKTRLVLCEESGDGKRFSSDLVKKVTGQSPIEAEAKGRQPFTYMPKFKVTFITNYPPRVSDLDDAFWRRIKLVDCSYIPPQKDRHLPAHLATMGARKAILAWIISGAVEWHKAGLQAPPEVENANKAYRQDQDPISEYLIERTVWSSTLEALTKMALPNGQPMYSDSTECQVAKAILRTDYMAWCKTNGQDPIAPRNFNDRLRRLGASDDGVNVFNPENDRSERGWDGLRLRNTADDGALPNPAGGRAMPVPGGPLASRRLSQVGNSEAAATGDSRSSAAEPVAQAGPAGAAAGDQIGKNLLPQSNGDPAVASQPAGASSSYDAPQQDNSSPATSDPNTRAHTHAPGAGAHAHATRASIQPVADVVDSKEGSPAGGDTPSEPPPGSRAAKLRQPPHPGEDLFADPPPPADPPMREPGADEDEPPWDPTWGVNGPSPKPPTP